MLTKNKVSTRHNMKSSILKEAISAILVKKPISEQKSEWTVSSTSGNSSRTSSKNSTSNSKDSTPTGSCKHSRKNSPVPDEAQPSTLKKKSRYTFYSTNLVEHRIVQPGSNCLPFPWNHNHDTKNVSN